MLKRSGNSIFRQLRSGDRSRRMIPQLCRLLTLRVDSFLTREYDSRHPKKWMIKQVHAQKVEVTRDSRLDTAVKQRVNEQRHPDPYVSPQASPADLLNLA